MKIAALNQLDQSLFERVIKCYQNAGLPSLDIKTFGPAEHIREVIGQRPYYYELTPNYFVADNKLILSGRLDDDGWYVDIEVIPNDASYSNRHATRCYQLLKESLFH